MEKQGVTIVSLWYPYPDLVGGEEIFAYRLVKALRRRGYPVRVVAKCVDSSLVEEYAELGVQLVCGVPRSKVHVPSESIQFAIITAIQTLSFFVREVVSAMPTFLCLGSQTLIVGYPIGRLLKKRVVVRYAGGDLYGLEQKVRSARDRILKMQFRIGLWLSKSADTVVVTADWETDALVSHGVRRSRIVKIQNGVETIGDSATEGIGRQGPRLIHVGSLVKEFYHDKRVDLLISVFAKYREKFPSSTLTLVGGGPETNNIVRQVQALELGDSVKFTGRVRHEDIPRLLAAADFFVLPSMLEGMSNALSEAVAFGIPVVASDIPPNREILGNAPSSILFDPTSEASFLTALETMTVTLEERKLEGRAMARKMAPQLSFDRTVQLYASVLSRSMIR